MPKPALPALPRVARWGAAAALALMAAGCGGGGGSAVGSGGTGVVQFHLTDAPACGYEQVNVTIKEVAISQSASGDSGWQTVAVSPARRIDLLTLTNGALESLGQAQLPAGTYRQLRLVLADNDLQGALENSVKPVGKPETALTTPSAQQTGVKVNVDVTVPDGKVADVVIDFDACRSVVARGNSGRYNLKPVLDVKQVVLTDAGRRIVGWLTPSMAADAIVSAQQAGVVKKATTAVAAAGADQGKFTLYPLDPGSYDVVVTTAGRVTAVITGVPVAVDAPTQANPPGAPIDAPSSPSGEAKGSVSLGAGVTEIDATVAAGQSLGSTKVEVASQPVAPDTGAYGLNLPVGAPVQAPYSAASAPSFAAAASAAAKYTLTATTPGQAPKTAPEITVGSTPVTTDFVFP